MMNERETYSVGVYWADGRMSGREFADIECARIYAAEAVRLGAASAEVYDSADNLVAAEGI
jgi:hypothetical protein